MVKVLEIGESKKVTLTDKEEQAIIDNPSIAAAAILKNEVTGHEFTVYDYFRVNSNGSKFKTKTIKKKLQEERILLSEDSKTGEKEREYTKVYTVSRVIKGGETFLKKSEKELSVLEKITKSDEEIYQDDFGMTKEEIQKLIEDSKKPKEIKKGGK